MQEPIVSGCEIYRHYYHDRAAVAIEEALSNAYAFRPFLRRQPRFVLDKVREWMKAQGPGYRDFESYLPPSKFIQWCRIATHKMQEPTLSLKNIIKISSSKLTIGPNPYKRIGGNLTSPRGRSISVPTEFLFAGLTRSTEAPIRLIADVKGIGVLKPFVKYKGLRVLVHVNDHQPPHIHLEIPPGRDFTTLKWPTLNPLPGDPELSVSQERLLNKYLDKYGDRIDKKVRTVYQLTS